MESPHPYTAKWHPSHEYSSVDEETAQGTERERERETESAFEGFTFRERFRFL